MNRQGLIDYESSQPNLTKSGAAFNSLRKVYSSFVFSCGYMLFRLNMTLWVGERPPGEVPECTISENSMKMPRGTYRKGAKLRTHVHAEVPDWSLGALKKGLTCRHQGVFLIKTLSTMTHG